MKFSGKWACIYGFVLGALCVAVGGAAFSQQGEHQQMSAGDIVAKMKDNLNLTDDQVSQITPVIEANMKQRQALMGQAKAGGSDRDVLKGQMAALRQDMESKLAQYLTPEQLEKWKNNMQQRHSGGRGHHGMGGGESSATGSTSGNGQ